MLSAIQELADNRLDECEEHLAVLKYLQACNLIFEKGILSEKCIYSSPSSSPILENIKEGFMYFEEWRNQVSLANAGKVTMLLILYLSVFILDYSFRSPHQKDFLA